MRLFDLHCDTLYELYQRGASLLHNRLHVDLDRASQFSAWSQVFAIWIPDEWRGEKACRACDEMIHLAKQQFAECSSRISLVTSGEQMRMALDSGRCAAWLSVEGGAALGGRLERVKHLSQQGVRMMTLTWNGENELGNGCLSPYDTGLTAFGKAVVDEMQTIGMLVDVSHLNARGFYDVVERMNGPFLATHSVSNTVHPHPRNLTDEQFAIIRERGGLVGLNLCASQLGEASFEAFEKHLSHFLEQGGENILALGCDLDGTVLPEEWSGIEVLEQIGGFLTRKNYSKAQIDRLFFKNAHDFFTKFDTTEKV